MRGLQTVFTSTSRQAPQTAGPQRSLPRTFCTICLGCGTFVSLRSLAIAILVSRSVFCAGAYTPVFPTRTSSMRQTARQFLGFTAVL